MSAAGIFLGIAATCIAIIFYQYALYPLLVALAARLFGAEPTPASGRSSRSVSLVIAAYNEGKVLEEKLANSAELRFRDLDVILVTDGSDDGSASTTYAVPGRRFRHLHDPVRAGKASAMNRGAAESSADIIVFSDANALYDADAILALDRFFDDPRCGLVSGRKSVIRRPDSGGDEGFGQSEGTYWRYEHMIRRAEDRLGSTVATNGEILAMRRRDFPGFPAWVVNDDAYLALHVLKRGMAVRYATDAISRETASLSEADETSRRSRIAAGRLELVARPQLWPVNRPLVMWQLVSHKWLRLVTPILAIVAFVSALISLLLSPGLLAALLAGAQVLFYVFAFFGSRVEASSTLLGRVARIAWFLVRSNAAIIAGYRTWLRHEKPTLWQKAERGPTNVSR